MHTYKPTECVHEHTSNKCIQWHRSKINPIKHMTIFYNKRAVTSMIDHDGSVTLTLRTHTRGSLTHAETTHTHARKFLHNLNETSQAWYACYF